MYVNLSIVFCCLIGLLFKRKRVMFTLILLTPEDITPVSHEVVSLIHQNNLNNGNNKKEKIFSMVRKQNSS